jgi:hypothetical protein
MSEPSSAPPAKRPARRAWTPPKVTCLAARPEISAYSGDINPWPSSR